MLRANLRGLMVFIRAIQIFVVTCVAACRYALGRMRLAFVRDDTARSAALGHLRGRVLRNALAQLGTTFVKLGQVMSTRVDLFPRETIEELRLLQDRLPPFGFDEVSRIIATDLGAPIAELFCEFDVDPVAAASVAQVHRARLQDGREVAVKVLRPNIRRRAIADGKVLEIGARLLELSDEIRLSEPVAHLRELESGIIEQTDLRIEAANYERFRANFESMPEVRFPHVHHALSGEHVLTMEFLRGKKADALPPGEHPELARLLSRLFMKMAFQDGLLHADLHPGNFLVLDDGTVAIFDVGLAKHLSPELLDEFVDFSRCLAMGTTDDLVQHAKTYHKYLEGTVDWEAFALELGDFVAAFRGKTKEELELTEFFDTIFALGRRHRVQPRTEFTLIIVGIMTAEGVGKLLDAKADFMADIAMFLMPLLAEKVAREARAHDAAEAAAAALALGQHAGAYI